MRAKIVNFLKTNWPLLLVLFLVYVVATVLFVYGHFNDRTVALDAYDPTSIVARLVAGYGPIPLFLTMMVLGVIAIVIDSRHKLWLTILKWLIGVVLIGAGLYFMVFKAVEYRSGYPLAATLVVGLLVTLLTVAGAYWFVRNISSSLLLKAAIVIAAIAILEYGIGEIVKPLWSRPRPYLLFEVKDLDPFLPWFMPGAGKDIKALIDPMTLFDPAEFSDYFKSFPSGHTSHSLFLLSTSTILLSLKPKTRKYLFVAAIVGALFGFFVAYGRILIGAHYLTDTMAGFSLTFLLYLFIGLPFVLKLSGTAENS